MADQPLSREAVIKGGADLFALREDTLEARAVVAEARALLFGEGRAAGVRKSLRARGAGKHATLIVHRSLLLEWDAVVKAASTDIEAGERDTPNVIRARALTAEITRRATGRGKLEKLLLAHGASSALAPYLANDPRLRKRSTLPFWLIYLSLLAILFWTFTMERTLGFGAIFYIAVGLGAVRFVVDINRMRKDPWQIR